jgi:hypothetical protein
VPYQPGYPGPGGAPYQPGSPVPGGAPWQPPVAPPGVVGPPARSQRTLVIVLVVALVLLLTCCVGGAVLLFNAAGDGTFAGAGDPASTAAAAPTRRAPEPTTGAGEPSATPPATLPADATYTGRGAKVVKLSLRPGYQYFAAVTHHGDSNFFIHSIDSRGKTVGLLVNEIGDYAGSVPVNLDVFSDDISALKVTADGTWKLVVRALEKAPRFDGSATGRGDAVLLVPAGMLRDLATAKVSHNGARNFVIRSYGPAAFDLLVNEIGRYSGETVIADDTTVLEVRASGTWSITLE